MDSLTADSFGERNVGNKWGGGEKTSLFEKEGGEKIRELLLEKSEEMNLLDKRRIFQSTLNI